MDKDYQYFFFQMQNEDFKMDNFSLKEIQQQSYSHNPKNNVPTINFLHVHNILCFYT